MKFFSRNGRLVSESEAKAIDSGKGAPKRVMPHDLDQDAKDFIARTERRADSIIGEARSQAKSIVEEAQAQADRTLAEAQKMIDKLLQEAQTKADESAPNEGSGHGSVTEGQ